MTFASLGLSHHLLDAVAKQGYKTPSPIQAQAIPPILKGSDVLAAAQTGTGKTAGFTLPIIQNLTHGSCAKANSARALILTPTRELAAQVGESVVNYSKDSGLRSAVVFGGVKINPQMQKLRKGVDILVATPGRLLDLYEQNAVRFSDLEVLVLDEADRMLDMGFIHDIRKIIHLLPKKRQNLLFSATFSKEIRQLAQSIVVEPVEVSVSPPNAAAPTVEQWIHPVDKGRKPSLLAELIRSHNWSQVLVFCRTKHGANKLVKFLDAKQIKAAAIHGNKSQGARTRALANFKTKEIQVLVATDIAARGIDIDQLPIVVNMDLPNVPEDYVHRIGRTGRAEAAGKAFSLVCQEEVPLLSDIENLIQAVLTRIEIKGYEPKEALQTTSLSSKVKKIKKPKKKKPTAQNGDTNGTQQRRSSGQHQNKDGQNKRQKTKGNQGSKNQGKGSEANNKRSPQNPSNRARRRPAKRSASPSAG